MRLYVLLASFSLPITGASQKNEKMGGLDDAHDTVSQDALSLLTLKVKSMDGKIILGPEQLDSTTLVSQLGELLLSKMVDPISVDILYGNRKLDYAVPLKEIEHTGVLELTAVFQQLSIDIHYRKDVTVYTTNTYSLSVMSGATLEEFQAEVEQAGRTLTKMKGSKFAASMRTKQYHREDRPQEAELLEKLLQGADEAWVDQYTTGMSRGVQYMRAFVKGHQISDEFHYSFD